MKRSNPEVAPYDHERVSKLLMEDELFVKRFITEFSRGPTRNHARYDLGSATRRFYERASFGRLLERYGLGELDTNLGEELDIYLSLALTEKGRELRERIYSRVGKVEWHEISKKGWYHYANMELLSQDEIGLLKQDGIVRGRTLRGWYELFLTANDIEEVQRLTAHFPTLSDDRLDVDDLGISIITDERLIRAVARDPSQIFTLTPREFEQFTAELLESFGYKNITLGRGSKDGGVDVSAFIEHKLGVERIIVRCKHNALANKVGEPTIKQLYADTELHKAMRGLLITTSYLTRRASMLVQIHKHRLSAIDHDDLMQLLRNGFLTVDAT